jgi:hypothetical protein
MLKLTYTETGFYLEYIAQSLEDWVQARVILALRVGQSLCVEPSTASFLLPANLPGVDVLRDEVSKDREHITVCVCDAEYVEVSLRGSWISSGSEDASGVFATTISLSTEFFLHKLWLEAQACQEVRG